MEKINNNELLRTLRYILDYNDDKITEIFKLGGFDTNSAFVKNLLKQNNEPDFTPCSDNSTESFLNGLIIHKRGPSEKKSDKTADTIQPLTNNIILKKLRIAFDLKSEDMFEIFELADHYISKEDLNDLFRRSNHKNYKNCGTHYIRLFLQGLTAKYRTKI